MEKKNKVEKVNKINIEDLFAAGFQYGHKGIKSSPKMKKYIHSVKWGISVIDLCQTAQKFEEALDYLYTIVKKGGSVLFLGTKYQAKDLIVQYAKACGQYYINKRWLGGSITNYANTIQTQIQKLEAIERMEDLGIVDKYGKKEQAKIAERKNKLLSLVEGVRSMQKLPDLLIVVDAKKENIALLEAKIQGIPTIVLADTDTKDPSICSHIVPGNDDGFYSIDFFLNLCKEVILAAQADSSTNEKAQEKTDINTGENDEIQENIGN